MIVEFQFDISPFREALAHAPDVVVEMEDLVSADTLPLRTYFWAHGSGLDTFEEGLEVDPTTRDPERITGSNESRFYRVTHPWDLPAVEAYRAAVELDAIILAVTGSTDGIEVRARFPDREAFAEWREHLQELEISIEVLAIYSEDEIPPERHYGISEQQREALLTAAEEGYFSIPRETSLAGLAEELNVSSQAASERLRRGMEQLVFSTVGDEHE
jgi:predicted DNA binding protein